MSNDPIICEICGGKTHVIAKHLKEKHPEFENVEYQKAWQSKNQIRIKADYENGRAKEKAG